MSFVWGFSLLKKFICRPCFSIIGNKDARSIFRAGFSCRCTLAEEASTWEIAAHEVHFLWRNFSVYSECCYCLVQENATRVVIFMNVFFKLLIVSCQYVAALCWPVEIIFIYRSSLCCPCLSENKSSLSFYRFGNKLTTVYCVNNCTKDLFSF